MSIHDGRPMGEVVASQEHTGGSVVSSADGDETPPPFVAAKAEAESVDIADLERREIEELEGKEKEKDRKAWLEREKSAD